MSFKDHPEPGPAWTDSAEKQDVLAGNQAHGKSSENMSQIHEDASVPARTLRQQNPAWLPVLPRIIASSSLSTHHKSPLIFH